MKRIAVFLPIALAAALQAGSAMAFTDKPVKLIVPAPPGGTIDVFARIISDQLALEIKQPVIVENRPGAGGALAIKYMLSQPADGNTLLVTVTNILTEVPHVLKGGFDPMKDVRPASQMARSLQVFIASPQFPAKDAKEAIAYVKAHPGQVSFASYSQGTTSQYAGVILNQKAGLDMQHVPFPGSAPALAQVMGNQIPLMFASAKTPQPLMEKIHATMQKINASQAVQARYQATGFEPIRQERSLEQLSTDLRAEFDRNGEIVKTYGIKLN